MLTELDRYADKIERLAKQLKDLKQQDTREIEFVQLVTKTIDKEMSEEEMETLLGVNKLRQMDLEEDYEIYQKEKPILTSNDLPGSWNSLDENLVDALNEGLSRNVFEKSIADDWEGINWSDYEKEVYRFNDSSKFWNWLKTNHDRIVTVNGKVKEYIRIAEMVRQLLVEIETINVSGYKKADEAVLKYVLTPIIKKLGKKGQNIGNLIEKCWLAEDARWLAGNIEKYNNKVKVGSEYIERGTNYLGKKLSVREQKARSKDYADLVNIEYKKDKQCLKKKLKRLNKSKNKSKSLKADEID